MSLPSVRRAFVAVHAGAGYHRPSDRKSTLDVCREACEIAAEKLRTGATATEAAVTATVVLENSPLTNAGFGSNLTLNETVECDAGLMDGKHADFAAVGAISNVKNPILVASELLRCHRLKETPFDDTLVSPVLLVGSGATKFAASRGLDVLHDGDLVTSQSSSNFRHVLRSLQPSLRQKLDTVGAVCMDLHGDVAASCSSGGLMLKMPGRVGHAAHYGCGCWAKSDNDSHVAVSTSGCGEILLKMQFARTLADILQNQHHDLTISSYLENFWLSDYAASYRPCHRIAGFVALQSVFVDNRCTYEFIYGHNAPNFCLAYCFTEDSKVKAVFSKNGCLERFKINGNFFK